jgi:crotonobetainyl-CoA:carnitine CoA-transferase CaiB-like acyl-CoA transferase
LIEALLDFQFEVLTTHLNDGRRPPRRSAYRNAHAYLAAPYGVYDTADGYLAIAMTHLPTLGKLLGLHELEQIADPADGFRNRDSLKQTIAHRLKEHTTEHWLEILNAADIWCAEVLDWPKLCASEAFRQLDMVQTLRNGSDAEILTTRLPIRFDGNVLKSEKLAPRVGQHNTIIEEEFGL